MSASPRELRNDAAARVLHVTWDDRVAPLPYRVLRGYCPCAHCQGHGAGPRKFIENNATLQSIKAVGHYAVQLGWDDGHNTGLYTFDYLRQLVSASAP